MTKAVFPILLAILALVQLVSCLCDRDSVRMPTKIFLMPFVALAYLSVAKEPSGWVVAGLMFGCLGDLALLWPLKPIPFALGTSAFALGHVCYLIFIFSAYPITVKPVWITLIALVYLAGCVVVYLKSRPNIPQAVRPVPFPYMLILSSVSVCTLLALISSASWGRALAFLGATSFLASDGILSDMLFVKKAEPPKQNFAVMATYTAAQVLLAVGWAL